MISRRCKVAALVAALPLSQAWAPVSRTGHRVARFPRRHRVGIAASEDPVVNVGQEPEGSDAVAANGGTVEKEAAPVPATFMLGDAGLSSEATEVLLKLLLQIHM